MGKKLEWMPQDLLAAIILALATLVFTLTPPIDLFVSIPSSLAIVLLFVPGYTLTSALFPKIGDLGRVARIALSFGLGIAVVPLICLALNYTPWGIRLVPVAASLAIFTLFTAAGSLLAANGHSGGREILHPIPQKKGLFENGDFGRREGPAG